MLLERIEKLQEEYTDQYVVVDSKRPELARFQGITGRVKTINMNGRALVQFEEDKNCGWYDIELDYLKVVDMPEPKAAKAESKLPQAAKSPAKNPQTETDKETKERLSPLELARLEKAAQEKAVKPSRPANSEREDAN